MNINKLGNILLIIFVLLLIINVVSAEDNTLVGADDGKLMLDTDSDSSISIDDGAKLGATDSQQTLKAGEVGNYTELQSLVNANLNGVITLDKDYAYVDGDPTWVQISNSITINGNGHNINGNNKKMSFYIPEGVSYVTLNNITFINGYGNSMLWINGHNCLVDNCTFEKNLASNGGAIRLGGYYNTVNNSVFNDNIAKDAGAIYASGSYNSISNCTFEHNNAAKNAGAVDLQGYHNLIYNSTFKSNYAKEYAGAVYSYHQDNTIDGCTFDDNHADIIGGAVYMNYINSVINNSKFNRNYAGYYAGAVYLTEYADKCIINNSKFNENYLDYDQSEGSAVYVSTAKNVKILNSEFNKHEAKVGGAVYWMGINGTVKGSTFNENTATSFGGAIYWLGENGTIEDNEFNKNHADQGGAIYVLKPNLLIDGSKFSENTADRFAGAIYIGTNITNTTVKNSEFRKNKATERSGAIDIHGENNTIDNSIFEENAAEYGGAIGIAKIVNFDENLNNTIRDSTFNKNKAEHDGGAVLIASKGNTIDGSKFYYNTAANFAGAIKINDKSEFNVINNSYFEHNSAFQGGSIYVYPSNITINNTQMWSNNATEGGALFVFVGENVTVNNSVFGQNSASKNGGAAFWLGANGTVDNTHFYNNGVNAKNEKNVYGGAVYWTGNNAKINNSNFTYNSIRNKGNFSDGGALSIHDDYAIVENCLFEDNSADVNGGAINWAGDHGSIYKSVFNRNTANVEGGAVNGFGKNLLINGSNFTKNSVSSQVGGALALDAFGTVDNSIFIENSAHKGGAIHWIDEGACLINNSYFYKNHAYYAGGAISCDFFYYHADKYIQNTRFINNTCQNYGGAIASLDTEIDNCTFINNSANMGGAIHSYDSKINGSHFSDNSAKYGNDIYHSGTLDLIDLEVPDKNIVYVPSDLAEIVRYNIGNSTRLMNNSYIGMCFERWSLLPKYGAYDESLQGLINVISKESIVEYLKLLIYESFNSMEEVYPHEDDNYVLYPEGYEDYPDLIKDDKSNWVPISRTDYYSRAVHVFSDHDFRKSKHPVVQKILKLYDNGVRISQDQTKMVNGTLIKYHFSTLMSPASQSLFLFLITPIPKIDKTYLNTTDFVTVNDTVAFNITVNNTGDKPLVNITIKEIYNSTELEYIGHSNNETWIKNNDTFTFYHDPDVGDIVIYNIYLENTGGKNLENIVFGNVYDPTQLEFVKCANEDLIKNHDDTFLFIDEIRAHRNKTLSLYFKVLDKDIVLSDMTPEIIKYDESEDNDIFSHDPKISVEREYIGRFSPINVGEAYTFTIWFKTLTNGTLVNNVSLNAHALREVLNATNHTTVYKPNLTVEKIALNSTEIVYVGDLIAFNITVNNTGDCSLYNLTINEIFNSTELKFIRYSDNKTWIRNNNTFIYNGTMAIGDLIAFNITVNNTGACVISNVTIGDIYNSSELSYFKGADGKLLIKKGENFILNQTLGIGESKIFTLWFKTLVKGNLTEMKPTATKFNVTEEGSINPKVVVNRALLKTLFPLHKGENSTLTVWFKTLTNGTLVNNVTAKAVGVNETPANNSTVVYKRITVNVTKVWRDAQNQDGVRPNNVTIILLAGDVEINRTVLSEKNNWTDLFEGLPIFNDKNETIKYTIQELAVANYNDPEISEVAEYNWTVVNTHVPEVTSVNVTKVWCDADNQDGIRPDNITVILRNDTAVVAEYVLNASNSWKHTFTNLPVYINKGNLINYTVVEKTVPKGYMNDIVKVDGYNYLINNSYTPQVTSVNVTKVWCDADNQDGIRPDNITVILRNDTAVVAEYVLNASNSWKHTFTNLPVYINKGNLINYTVVEKTVPKGYMNDIVKVDGYNYLINNSYTPQVTSVNVTKVWCDADNQDGVRPVSVTVVLKGDGDVVGTATLNASNNWSASFEDLPVYSKGKLIEYSVEEVSVANYTSVVIVDSAYSFIVNNTHVPVVTDVSVVKVWNDNNNQDGVRPVSVTVVLKGDGDVVGTATLNASNNWSASFEDLPVYSNGNEIEYSVEEVSVANYTSVVIVDSAYSFIVNNTHVPVVTDVSVVKVWNDANDQDGVRPAEVTVVLVADGNVAGNATLNASNNWSVSFSDLPVYNNGKLIEYSVEEVSVANYTTAISNDTAYNWIVNNTHVPVVTDVSVVKVWNDVNDQDGVRPAEVTVVLVADGNVAGNATLDASNNWSVSFSDLPVYNNGKLIEYSVEELKVANYTSVVIVDSAYSFIVNNTHVPVVTDVSVVKVWNDADNQDGVRPVDVTVVLVADGNVVSTTTLNANNNWYASFSDLPVYSNGKLIEYTVQELDVANYTSVVSGDAAYSFTVVNTHVPLVTSVNVTKVWNDANNQDGLRPVDVTVVLVADGNVVSTATLDDSNNWHASFEDLPVYSNGKLIKYSVEELEVANYTSIVSSDSAYSFTVNNTHVPLITVVNITKVWRSDNNRNEEPVVVIIYADGVQVANITLNPGNNWKFTFDDLPAYKDGKKINYTVGVVEGNRTVNITGEDGNFTIIAEPEYHPDMSVQKITLDTEVEVGDLVSFEIVVENTGDCDLTGVYVIDNEYSEGLVFEYMEPNDEWTYEGNGKFTYNGILGVGESTSFIVVFKATSAGFKVNTVIAGNNLTNKTVNSTNTTNVTEEVPPEPDVPVDEPPVPHKHHVPKHVKPDSRATGNPILLLLLALIIPIIRRKQN